MSIIQTRYEAAADELHQLQMEPAYLRYVLKERETSLRRNGIADAEMQEKLFMVPMVRLAYLISWNRILSGLKKLQNLEAFYSAKTGNGVLFPDEYEETLRSLELLLRSELSSRTVLVQDQIADNASTQSLLHPSET
jgi:hypothetical protein